MARIHLQALRHSYRAQQRADVDADWALHLGEIVFSVDR